MSCHSRNNKWCILTALGTIYSIGFGFDNDTFIEKLIYRIGWSNFEINSLLFVPVTLLILLTFYSNQKHKELLVQNSKYVERYREKELRQKRMESGEQKLREMRVQESGKLNGEMAEAGAPDSGNISGKKDSGKSSYMDDI